MTQALVIKRTYAWALVGVLWVVALLNYVDRQAVFSVLPLLKADLKLSEGELGLLSTVFLWLYGVLSPIAGYTADRLGRSRIILLSLVVWSIVTAATGFARNFTQLIAARALMGVSEACYLPAALALIADHHRDRTRSLATGIHQSGLYAGIVLGGAGGGWLGQRFGWRLTFFVLGGCGVLYFVFLSRFLRPGRVGTPPPVLAERSRLLGSWRKLLFLPGFVKMTAVFSAVSVANWIVYTWLALYLHERFQMGLALAGFSATFYIQAASFAGILAGGWLADRWSTRTLRGRLYIQAVGLAMAAPFLFAIGSTESRSVLILSFVAFGLGRGFYDCNAMPVLCQIVDQKLRATGYGLFNLAACLAGGIAAALAGILKKSMGLESAFRVAGLILLLSVFLLLRIRLIRWDSTQKGVN